MKKVHHPKERTKGKRLLEPHLSAQDYFFTQKSEVCSVYFFFGFAAAFFTTGFFFATGFFAATFFFTAGVIFVAPLRCKITSDLHIIMTI